MTLDLVKLNRRTFEIAAVRVTVENIIEVAGWCNGVVKETDKFANKPSFCVEFKTIVGRVEQIVQAYLGDWVTGGKVFKTYTDVSIRSIFVEKDMLKLGRIRSLVAEAMYEQDQATKRGKPEKTGDYTDVISQKIYNLM
jgi:hypothetical protein